LKEKSLKGKKKEEEEKKEVFLCHLEVFCNFVFGAEPSLLNSQVLCWKIFETEVLKRDEEEEEEEEEEVFVIF
jgi:hypothetical protein